jgi:hydrogenase maturation protease
VSGDVAVVVGVGHPDRGDDAVGLLVARRLGGRTVVGDLATIAWRWEPEEDVVIVDAMVSGAPAGTVRWLGVDELGVARASLSSHGVGLAEGLALAGRLGRLPARLRVIGVEGACFTPGAPMTPAVRAAVDAVVAELTPPRGACGGSRSSG